MIKNVMSLKPLTSLFVAATIVGAFSYSNTILTSQNETSAAMLALEAFNKAKENLNFLAQRNEVKIAQITTANNLNVNDRIVNVIETEIKNKISDEKRKSTFIASRSKKSQYASIPVIKKSWSGIKPVLGKTNWETTKTVKLKSYELKKENVEVVAINNAADVEPVKFNETVQIKPILLADEVNVLQASPEIDSSLDLNDLEKAELEEFKAEIAASEKVYPETKSEEILAQDELLIPSSENGKSIALAEKEEINFKKDEEEYFEKQLAAAVVTDEVSTQMASAVSAEAPKKEIIKNDDDLVMYDYSKLVNEKSPSETKKIFDEPLSNTVKEAIQREVKGTEVQTNVLTNPSRKAIPKNLATLPDVTNEDGEKSTIEQDQIVFDYPKKEVAKNDYSSAIQGFVDQEKEVSTQASLKIKAFEINLNTQKIRQSVGYEFVPDYERAERMDDQAGGEIEISSSLSSDQATLTGVIQAQGFIPTRIEANILDRKMEVPLFDEVGIQKFLEKKKIMIVGNIIVIGLSDEISDVDLDTQYQEKLYFNKNYQLLKDPMSAEYVMVAGVAPGNHMLKYSLKNKETASKIIYVGDGELYYDNPEFEHMGRDIYTFTTRSLLGKKIKELNINTEDVKMYGSSSSTKKKSLNSYELKLPVIVNNNRKYIEFKHLGYPLYVGTGTKKELEVPGNDFISKVLNTFELNQLGERCLLQVNLSKEVRNVTINGKNKSGEMFIESVYLDNEGGFSSDSAELAEKVFVTGDQEGIMSARIDYTDGTTDYLKSFCSQGSYLIEQL